jgi:hypothetical protein
VAARTELLAIVAALARTAAADPTDDDILGRDARPHAEDVELRTSFIDQHGHGYQSQAGPRGEPGSEQMTVFEPSALVIIRQSDKIVHEITIPVDIITAASPDAVDATTSASRRNESADVDVRSTFKRSEVTTLSSRFAVHVEEPMGSGTIGGGYKRSFADDNATVAINGNFTFDYFDDHDQSGLFLGKTNRETANVNVSGSQLLSPTTVVDASYGLTYQHGTLRTGWNAVPVDFTMFPTFEVLPHDRTRNALAVRLSQHLPWTHSTIKAWYRAYVDDFGIDAHTVELAAYQYLVPWLYVRGSYRYHHQTGASFFTTNEVKAPSDDTLRTADSDLAPFSAHEWTVELAMVRGRAPGALRGWSLGAELMRYTRTNDLQITAVSLTIGKLL